MPSSKTQLQQDNARLTAQCETLETELASLQQRYQALSRSEARYRQAVENSPISISFLSADGQHVEANAAFERMMGFTVEDSQRVGFNLFTDPALEANGTCPYILRALAGETVIEPPINFYDASQLYGEEAVEQYTPGQGHYFPIWNEDGEVQEIVEMAPVVTDLLQAQAEAQAERECAAKERAKLLSTVAQVANLLLRSQDFAAVLPEVVRLLGEAVGSDRCEVFRHDAGAADDLGTMQFLSEWCAEGVSRSTDISFDLSKGFPCQNAKTLYDKNVAGEVANVVVDALEAPLKSILRAQGTQAVLSVPIMLAKGWWGAITFDNCQNATQFDEAEIAILQVAAESIAAAIERQVRDEELREAERRYRTLFELSNEGIFRFEFEPSLSLALSPEERMELGYQVNQIVEVNHAFVEQYGCDTPEDLVGTKIGDFYDHEYSQANDQVNLDLVRDLRVSKIETVETDRLGNRHWFLSSVVCDVRDDAIVGGWGVQTDITELKQAQQSLLEAEQARALELERYNTDLKQAVEQLQARDRILNATAESVTSLLTDSEFDRAIDQALEILGTSVECDRVEIFQHFADETEQSLGVLRLQFEWYSTYATPQQAHPTLTEITQDGLEALWLRLRAGDCLTGAIESYPEPFRSGQIELGVQSTHAVPIFVEGHYWGIVAIDHCREQRQLTPVELSVFKTAATCIGSAIERDRTQKAILQAEQERAQELERFNAELQQALERLQARDRILEATADAANALLSNDNLNDAVDTALHIIGESLDTDRVNIIEVEPFDQNSNLSQVGWQILNEWNSASTVSQRLHPIHQQGDHTGIEEWLTLFSSGQSASFLLEELPEPFRSGQAEIGVKAYHAVPIFLEGTYWGNLGIDDCREAKHRDPAELAVLKTVAACIGSAIERNRTQKAILAAEQAKAQELQRLNTELQTSLNDIRNRDFIAETAATVANVLLQEDTLQLAITQALGFLGKALSLDRVAVIEISAPSPDISSVMWHVSYEWDSPATISQINHSRLAQGTFEGIEALYEQMSSGQVISYLLEELPEPFRSGQAELGVKTLHDVPIFVADEFWGAIGFDDCRQAKRLSQTEVSMLKIAADCIGSAIQRERLRLAELRTQQALLKAQQDRVAELVKTNQALKNSLDRLAAAPDLEAFLGYVLTEISQQFDGKTASLHLFNPDNQTLHLHQWVAQGRVYSRQEFHQFGPLAEPIAVTDSTAWAFLQQHKFPLVVNRDNAHQYMFPGTEDWQLDWADREALQSGINILLSSGETPLGMMCMYSASRRAFTSEELEIAQALSHQATLAIQLTHLASEAQQVAVLGERNRLARDIHDTLAQSLGGIVLHLQAADSIYTTDLQDKQTHITQACQLASQALTEARRSVQALRPQLLEQTTLDQALNSLLQQLTRNSSLQITYELHGSPYGLPPEVEEHLLRISREALANSLRHAQATELVVDFTYEPRQVQLRIQDNGQGFDTTLPTFGYGLITMQERAQQIAAYLHLSSQLGQGTMVQVTLPIVTTAETLHG